MKSLKSVTEDLRLSQFSRAIGYLSVSSWQERMRSDKNRSLIMVFIWQLFWCANNFLFKSSIRFKRIGWSDTCAMISADWQVRLVTSSVKNVDLKLGIVFQLWSMKHVIHWHFMLEFSCVVSWSKIDRRAFDNHLLMCLKLKIDIPRGLLRRNQNCCKRSLCTSWGLNYSTCGYRHNLLFAIRFRHLN